MLAAELGALQRGRCRERRDGRRNDAQGTLADPLFNKSLERGP